MVTTLRKGDLSARMAKKMGASRTHADAAINALVESIQDAMVKKEKVTITGFGSFEVKDVKARKMKAIGGAKTGQMISVPRHRRVKFSAGAHLYDAAQGRKKAMPVAKAKAKPTAKPTAKATSKAKAKKR